MTGPRRAVVILMGSRGPVPKRESQRRRRNKSPDGPTSKAAGSPTSSTRPPAPLKSWHPTAKKWFESLAQSGQSVFYEPSDWATAFLIAENMSRDLKPTVVGVSRDGKPVKASTPINGASLTAYLKAMSALLVTEGDRRRARVELEKPPADDEGGDGSVSWLDQARSRRQPRTG